MALTKAQIRDRVAVNLGVMTLGDSLANHDKIRIEQGYNEVYEYLKEENVATWSSTGSVPNAIAPYFIDMISFNCANDYAVSKQRLTRITTKYSIAEGKIRQIISPSYISQEEAKDY